MGPPGTRLWRRSDGPRRRSLRVASESVMSRTAGKVRARVAPRNTLDGLSSRGGPSTNGYPATAHQIVDAARGVQHNCRCFRYALRPLEVPCSPPASGWRLQYSSSPAVLEPIATVPTAV